MTLGCGVLEMKRGWFCGLGFLRGGDKPLVIFGVKEISVI